MQDDINAEETELNGSSPLNRQAKKDVNELCVLEVTELQWPTWPSPALPPMPTPFEGFQAGLHGFMAPQAWAPPPGPQRNTCGLGSKVPHERHARGGEPGEGG